MYLSEEVVVEVVLLLVCVRRHEVRVQLVSQVVALVGKGQGKVVEIKEQKEKEVGIPP